MPLALLVLLAMAILPASGEAARCAGCEEYTLTIPDPKAPTEDEEQVDATAPAPAPSAASPAVATTNGPESDHSPVRESRNDKPKKKSKKPARERPDVIPTVVPLSTPTASAASTGPWGQVGGSLALIVLISCAPAALVYRNRRRQEH